MNMTRIMKHHADLDITWARGLAGRRIYSTRVEAVLGVICFVAWVLDAPMGAEVAP